MSEPITLAIIAVASPIIIGVLKELLAAKKVKTDSAERQNEFLNKQLQEFRAYHEQQMDLWRTRYEKARDELVLMREQKLLLEWEQQRRNEADEAEEAD